MTDDDLNKLKKWFFEGESFPEGPQFKGIRKWFSGPDNIPKIIAGDHWSEVLDFVNNQT